jgi:hypothetical protein
MCNQNVLILKASKTYNAQFRLACPCFGHFFTKLVSNVMSVSTNNSDDFKNCFRASPQLIMQRVTRRFLIPYVPASSVASNMLAASCGLSGPTIAICCRKDDRFSIPGRREGFLLFYTSGLALAFTLQLKLKERETELSLLSKDAQTLVSTAWCLNTELASVKR